MNGASTAAAALSENCCGSPTSAEQTGCEGTCKAGSCGRQSETTSGSSGAHQTEASPATGADHLTCPGRHPECEKCLLSEFAKHDRWAVAQREPSHPCPYRLEVL
jgi:hypothetical protein